MRGFSTAPYASQVSDAVRCWHSLTSYQYGTDVAPAIWRVGRGAGLKARRKRAASNLRSGSHGRAVRGASSALVALADVHCLAMSGVGRFMVVQYGWGHVLHAATIRIQPLMLTQLFMSLTLRTAANGHNPCAADLGSSVPGYQIRPATFERCPVRSKDCITALRSFTTTVPQAVRVEHMENDDLWELQARWPSSRLPLLAAHVLARRAGLGRAAFSVPQRTR